mgnify:CR=1 FL=1
MESISQADRVESLKAGTAGAIATTFAATLWWIGVGLLRKPLPGLFPAVGASWLSLESGIHGAIALVSGGLFGITYRYAVRQDQNLQLRSGVVFAFALVRGLAQLEVEWVDLSALWQLGLPLAEGLWLFSVAALSLQWAIHRGWVRSLP